jgi:hypothetical protein
MSWEEDRNTKLSLPMLVKASDPPAWSLQNVYSEVSTISDGMAWRTSTGKIPWTWGCSIWELLRDPASWENLVTMILSGHRARFNSNSARPPPVWCSSRESMHSTVGLQQSFVIIPLCFKRARACWQVIVDAVTNVLQKNGKRGRQFVDVSGPGPKASVFQCGGCFEHKVLCIRCTLRERLKSSG